MDRTEMTNVLAVRDLKVTFTTPDGDVQAVKGVSFDVKKGETLAIVGESGSGKSQTMMGIMGLLASNGRVEGSAFYGATDLAHAGLKELNEVRGSKITMIFQEPMTSLDPLYTIGKQIAEPLRYHRGMGKRQARERVLELLNLVGIPDPNRRIDSYPHELSGGQRQRVMIAMALANEPDVLIADEPTTALDATVQIQILLLLRELQREFGMSVIFVTHDIGVAIEICDRVAVMYLGRIVEIADKDELFRNPRHPYTQALLASVPIADPKAKRAAPLIDGDVPSPINPPPGCAFHTRCRYAIDRCKTERPALQTAGAGHQVACWLNDGTGRAE